MNENIKWIGLALLGAILFFGFTASIVVFVMKTMKGEVYQSSLRALQKSSNVIESLGEPIAPSWLVLGNVSRSGSKGEANLKYSVVGTKEAGKVFVHATREKDKWSLEAVVVVVEASGNKIYVIERKP